MKYPIGIQSFDKMREDGFVYVDKTALIYKLVSVSTTYFLSRPRRFGKNLLVSTLDAYFKGRTRKKATAAEKKRMAGTIMESGKFNIQLFNHL